MTARHWALGLSLTLVALPVLAGETRAHGSSSGGHEKSGAGHGASVAHAVPRGGAVSGGGYAARSSGYGARPRGGYAAQSSTPETRHPRAGTGHGYGHYGYGYYRGYYPYYGYYGYYPAYWGGYWGLGLGLGWDWGYPYGGYSYPGYYYGSPYYGGYRYSGGYYGETGSLRLLVDPPETRVFVDGYYSGVVDDYDGLFQRLHLSRGRHEIGFKLDGYQSYRVRVYVTPDHTLKIKHDMIRGTGEAVEDLSGGYAEAEAPPPPPDRDVRAEAEPRDERAPEPAYDREASGPGHLRFDVRPDDASIYVDGEFRGPARRLRELQVPAGRHLIEVVRPGYRTFSREVEVKPGRTEDVGIDMDRS